MVGSCILWFLSVIFVVHGIVPPVPTTKLNDGREMPIFGFGTWLGYKQNSRVTPQGNETEQSVRWAISAGYRHIDTASIYKVEDQVGRAIAAEIKAGPVTRDQLFVTTKLFNNVHARDLVVPTLRQSLAALQLDYVDLYLIHWPMGIFENGTYDLTDYIDTWKGMIEAKQLNLTRSIGVSNFNQEQIQRIINEGLEKPTCLQVELNLNLQQPNLLSYCKKENIAVVAYTPFGSLFPSKAKEDAPPPRVDDSQLVAIAGKYNKTVPQIVLRYLVELGVVPIPKSLTKERIEQNLQVFDFSLTQEERDLLKGTHENRSTKQEEGTNTIGVGRYPVMPSLVMLQQMRNRLHLAYLGRKLMKWSALATGKEMRKIAERLIAVYEGLEEEVKMAFIMVARCRYYQPDINLTVKEDVQKVARLTFSPTVKSCSGGIKYYEYEIIELEPAEAAYPHLGIGTGGQYINDTKNYWSDLLKKLVQILELRTAFAAIELSHHNATKKKNVLQKVIIPRLVATIDYILSELEEREREEVFRLKRFKQLKNKLATKVKAPANPEPQDNIPLQKDPSVIKIEPKINPKLKIPLTLKVTKVPPIHKFHKSDLKSSSFHIKTPICTSESCNDKRTCLMDDQNSKVLFQSDCKLCKITDRGNLTKKVSTSTPCKDELKPKPNIPCKTCDKSVGASPSETDRVTLTNASRCPNSPAHRWCHSCQEGLPIEVTKPSEILAPSLECCVDSCLNHKINSNVSKNKTPLDHTSMKKQISLRKQKEPSLISRMPCSSITWPTYSNLCCDDAKQHSMESQDPEVLEVKKKLLIVRHIISKDGTYREDKTLVITEILTESEHTFHSEKSSASWDGKSGYKHQKDKICITKKAKKPTSYSSIESEFSSNESRKTCKNVTKEFSTSSGYTWTNSERKIKHQTNQNNQNSKNQCNKSTNAYYVMASEKFLTNHTPKYRDRKLSSNCSNSILSALPESYMSIFSVYSKKMTTPSKCHSKCPPTYKVSIGNNWYYRFINNSDKYSSDDEKSCEDFADALKSSSISSSGSFKVNGLYMIKEPKIFHQAKTTFCFCASTNTNEGSNHSPKIECTEQKFSNRGYTISFSGKAIKTTQQQIHKCNLPKLDSKTSSVTQQQSAAKSLDNVFPYTPSSSYPISKATSSIKPYDAKCIPPSQELFYLVGRPQSLNVLENTNNIICKNCLMELSNYIPMSQSLAFPDCKLCHMNKKLQEKIEHFKRHKINKRDSSSSAVETTEFKGQTSFVRKPPESNETQAYSTKFNENNFQSDEYRTNKEKFITEVINFQSLNDISKFMNNNVLVQKDLDSNFLLTDHLMFTSFFENSSQEEENFEEEDDDFEEELKKSSALIRKIEDNFKMYSKFDNNQPLIITEKNELYKSKDKTGSHPNIVTCNAPSINSISISQEFKELKKEVNQVLLLTSQSQSKSNDSPQYESSTFRKIRDNLFTPDDVDISHVLYDPQQPGSDVRDNSRKKNYNRMKLRHKYTNTDTGEIEEKEQHDNDEEHDNGLQLNEKLSANVPQLVFVEEEACGSEYAIDPTFRKFPNEAVQTVDVGTNTKWRDRFDVRSLAHKP